jgi:hypothetical protein
LSKLKSNTEAKLDETASRSITLDRGSARGQFKRLTASFIRLRYTLDANQERQFDWRKTLLNIQTTGREKSNQIK